MEKVKVPLFMMDYGLIENVWWMSATVLRMQQHGIYEYPKELKTMMCVCA